MGSVNPRYGIVRKTQIEMFRKSGISPDDQCSIIELLGPKAIADHLGLRYIEVEEIQSGSSQFSTAGVLSRADKLIYVSREFPADQRRLTGMHEVVHWMLHHDVGRDTMHRDRPISHQSDKNYVDVIEWEATHIACLCLMPEKMVKNSFSAMFGTPYGQPLEMDEDVAFNLMVDIEELRKMGSPGEGDPSRFHTYLASSRSTSSIL